MLSERSAEMLQDSWGTIQDSRIKPYHDEAACRDGSPKNGIDIEGREQREIHPGGGWFTVWSM